jgi:multidrug efflux pump subunit AcrB
VSFSSQLPEFDSKEAIEEAPRFFAVWHLTPPVIDHYNGYPAIRINGSAALGHSPGGAMTAMEEIVQKDLPRGHRL